MDPRLATIDRRLERVGRVVAVTGGKGGIGKSLVATTLALTLAERGVRTGLLKRGPSPSTKSRPRPMSGSARFASK